MVLLYQYFVELFYFEVTSIELINFQQLIWIIQYMYGVKLQSMICKIIHCTLGLADITFINEDG